MQYFISNKVTNYLITADQRSEDFHMENQVLIPEIDRERLRGIAGNLEFG